MINPADGINRKISSMFTASSEERSLDEPWPTDLTLTCPKDSTRSKVNKNNQSTKETLPPLCKQPSALAAVLVSRPLFSQTRVLRNIPSQQTLSVKEFPCHVAQLCHGRALKKKRELWELIW